MAPPPPVTAACAAVVPVPPPLLGPSGSMDAPALVPVAGGRMPEGSWDTDDLMEYGAAGSESGAGGDGALLDPMRCRRHPAGGHAQPRRVLYRLLLRQIGSAPVCGGCQEGRRPLEYDKQLLHNRECNII